MGFGFLELRAAGLETGKAESLSKGRGTLELQNKVRERHTTTWAFPQ